MFLLGELALALKLVSLSLQSLFLKLGSALFFRSLGSEHASLSVLLLQSQSLSLLLLLPHLLLSLKLQLAHFELFFVTLGL